MNSPEIVAKIQGRSTYNQRDCIYGGGGDIAHNNGELGDQESASADPRILILASFGGGRLHNQTLLDTQGICPCLVANLWKDPLKVVIR